VRGLVTLPHSF
jgi:hypothetical protein